MKDELRTIYESILSKRKQLDEVTSLKNLIHIETEQVIEEFTSNISVEGVEEKIRDLEKMDLTQMDKTVIKSIDKVLAALKELSGVEYEGVIKAKESVVEDEPKDETDGEKTETPSEEDLEAELRAGDEEIKKNMAPEDEEDVFNFKEGE